MDFAASSFGGSGHNDRVKVGNFSSVVLPCNSGAQRRRPAANFADERRESSLPSVLAGSLIKCNAAVIQLFIRKRLAAKVWSSNFIVTT